MYDGCYISKTLLFAWLMPLGSSMSGMEFTRAVANKEEDNSWIRIGWSYYSSKIN